MRDIRSIANTAFESGNAWDLGRNMHRIQREAQDCSEHLRIFLRALQHCIDYGGSLSLSLPLIDYDVPEGRRTHTVSTAKHSMPKPAYLEI